MQNHNRPAAQNPQHFVGYQQPNASHSTVNGNQANQSYGSQVANQQPQRYHQQNGKYYHPSVSHHQHSYNGRQGPQHVVRMNAHRYVMNAQANQQQYQGFGQQQLMQHPQGGYYNNQQQNNCQQQYPLMQSNQIISGTDALVNKNEQVVKYF